MALPNPDLDILNSKSKNKEESTESTQDKVEYDNDDVNVMLLKLVKEAEEEDQELRWKMLSKWKRNDYYFNNIQKIFFDETAKDYRSIDAVVDQLQNAIGVSDIKIINIYRAYAESIVAALSVQPPSVEFTPDDAQNPDDIQTAEAYSRIAELVSRHNQAPLMLIKALITYFNCGVVFGHNYYKEDPAYGVIRTPKKTEQKPVQYADLYCGSCGELLDSGMPANVVAEQSRFHCKSCNNTGAPDIVMRNDMIDEVTEWTNTPKGRSCFDVFGPTYVKVSLNARNQESLGYLLLRLEDSVYKFREVYKNSEEIEEVSEIRAEGGDTIKYERWARIPPEYAGTLPKNQTTVQYCWIRPWFYNVLEIEEDIEYMQQTYPNGVMVTCINDKVIEKKHAKLDDEWTATFDPKSNYIHAEAPGNAIIPIQDAKNDVFNLGLQSIEYGIPETFANPKTLNIKKYAKSPHAVGMISPALPPEQGKAIGDGFFSLKTATLSGEYTSFDKNLDATGQFISSAIPTIWGGQLNSGSTNTATEYSDSGARALQRLQLIWQIMSSFWGKMLFKCATDFARNMKEDEKFSTKKNGTFINVWINKSALSGKVGQIEPEVNNQIPQSWIQKHAFFMQLIGMIPQSPQLALILLHPNNIENLKQIVGMPDFYLPGENDRNKQYSEYYIMSTRTEDNQLQVLNIDLEIDDHLIHMQVLKNILVSPVGIQLYESDPESYQNNIEHYKQHEMAMQAKSIAPSGKTSTNQPAETSASTSQG